MDTKQAIFILCNFLELCGVTADADDFRLLYKNDSKATKAGLRLASDLIFLFTGQQTKGDFLLILSAIGISAPSKEIPSLSGGFLLQIIHHLLLKYDFFYKMERALIFGEKNEWIALKNPIYIKQLQGSKITEELPFSDKDSNIEFLVKSVSLLERKIETLELIKRKRVEYAVKKFGFNPLLILIFDDPKFYFKTALLFTKIKACPDYKAALDQWLPSSQSGIIVSPLSSLSRPEAKSLMFFTSNRKELKKFLKHCALNFSKASYKIEADSDLFKALTNDDLDISLMTLVLIYIQLKREKYEPLSSFINQGDLKSILSQIEKANNIKINSLKL